MEKGWESPPFPNQTRYLLILALLVGHAAAGLAGRLAGGLALAAATVLGALAQVPGLQSLDSFHDALSILFMIGPFRRGRLAYQRNFTISSRESQGHRLTLPVQDDG